MSFEHPVTQGSEAWHRLRYGRPTASEFDNLLTPQFKVKTGEGPKTYLCQKLAEHVMGKSLTDGGSWAMEQGSLLESEGLPWYAFTYETPVRRVGFVTTDDLRIGCSPDGLLGDDGGIEFKCPQPPAHLSYLLDGGVPKQYLAQVHGCMFVTGRKWWKFVSYNRFFPALVVHVERDEAIQAQIREALTGFLEQFDLALAKLEVLKQPAK